MTSRYILLVAVAGIIVCLDQIVKFYIHTQYAYGERNVIIDGFFYITHIRNPGAAFGIFRDASETFRKAFFLTMPLFAMGIILYLIWQLKDTDRAQLFALNSIFGGAIGNYIDRVQYGFVIDYLDFTFNYNLPLIGKGVYSYPAFNIADIAIVSGVGVLLLLMFLEGRTEAKK